MSTLNLTNLLAEQMTGYLMYDEKFNAEQLKKINYVTAANGLFRVEKTPVAIYKSIVEKYKKPIPGLRVMTEGPELLIPKIPFKYLQMALSWYRDVNNKDKTEASLLFFWNKDNVTLPQKYSDDTEVKGLLNDGQLVIYVPRQKNSSTLSEFHMDPVVAWLRENLALLCETHSHNTMDAFFSSTDDANENATQFYGVWGKVTDDKPKFAFRYCSGDSKIKINPDVLFEWPKIYTRKTFEVTSDVVGFQPQTYYENHEEIYQGPFEQLDYPADWMDQHTKKIIVGATKYTGYNTPSRSYIAEENGNLQQIAWGGYDDGFSHYASPHWGQFENFDERLPFGSAFEDAEVIQLINNAEDEENLIDIQDNVKEITKDYTALGYHRVIEESLDAVKKTK